MGLCCTASRFHAVWRVCSFRAHETVLRVSGSAATSCNGVPIVSYAVTYTWTQTVGPALGLSGSAQDPRVLVIPKNTLTVGAKYVTPRGGTYVPARLTGPDDCAPVGLQVRVEV